MKFKYEFGIHKRLFHFTSQKQKAGCHRNQGMTLRKNNTKERQTKLSYNPDFLLLVQEPALMSRYAANRSLKS